MRIEKLSKREGIFIVIIIALTITTIFATYGFSLQMELYVNELKGEKQELDRLVQLAPDTEWWWKDRLNFTNWQLNNLEKTK